MSLACHTRTLSAHLVTALDAGVGHGWASSVDNGWDVQPTGWGSPTRDQPLFTVKIWNKLEPK